MPVAAIRKLPACGPVDTGIMHLAYHGYSCYATMPGGLASSWLQTKIVLHNAPVVLRPGLVAFGLVPYHVFRFSHLHFLRRHRHLTSPISPSTLSDRSPGGPRLLAATDRHILARVSLPGIGKHLACDPRAPGSIRSAFCR